ncbi:MAG TPA: FG-GAP-like repeat-containing protein [Luteimonas sp.]
MDSRIIAVIASVVLLGAACSSSQAPSPATTAAAGLIAQAPSPISGTDPAWPAGPAIAGSRTRLSRAAALPDHGEFARYPGDVARVTGAYTWHRAALSEAHALNAIASGHLRLTTPDGRLLDVVYDRHVEHASGDWTWIGHLAGHAGVQTVLTIGADAVFGSIGQDIGLPLRVTMRDGVSWLVETDGARVAELDNAATRPRRPDFHVPVQPRIAPRAAASLPAGRTATAATATTGTVDLLVGYTPGLRTAYGSASAAVTRINNLVDLTNTAYQNGGITGRVRLVHAMEVNYTDDNDNGLALQEMSGYEAGVGPTTPAPAFDALRAARETYGADLVTLLRDFRDPEHEGCGIAWLLGGALQGIQPGEGWDTLGYNVVSDGTDVNEEDGKSYFCRETTFAHEIGHNMGAAHDWVTAQGDDGTVDMPDDYGAYEYSFGYKAPMAMGNFYTIMAYGDAGQTGYTIFSTPDSTFCGGRPCGLDNADNVQTLNNTMPVVAGFRNEAVPSDPPAEPLIVDAARSDANADGRADLFWHSTQFQKLQPWLMNGTTWTYGTVRYVAAKYSVAGVGDFDGDGRADLLWRDDARTQLWMWRAKADGSYTAVLLRTWPTGWEIAGIGDANGDDRSDIHWYNASERKLQAWYMNGSAWSYGATHNTPANASILGVADFSGEGRADIAWHDETAGKVVVWLRGASDAYTSQVLRNYPTGWRVVAVADANADGRADLFWHNQALGRIQAWLMNGFAWTYGPVNPIASQYEVAAAGDFNGDGRADLVWQDVSLTRVWSWQARSNLSYAVALLRGYPTGWSLVH